ncbi:hypothetical protein D3C81_1917600 [compost metagenome]
MYLAIQLFRFIDWCLNSYILNLGGKTRFIFMSQLSGFIYYILLFIFADKIPQNNLLLIFLVGFVSIFKVSMGLIYFFSKRWMVRLNEQEIEV